jgi:hypothetical protein
MTGIENSDLLHDTCLTIHMIPGTMIITGPVITDTTIMASPVITGTTIITVPIITGTMIITSTIIGIKEMVLARVTRRSGKEGKVN